MWTKFHSRTVPAGTNVRQPCSFTLSSLTQPAEHLLSKINPTNYALILEAPISDCSSGYPVYCSGEQRRLQMEMYCHVRDHFSLQDPQGSSTCTLRLVIDYGQAFIIFASLFCMWNPRSRMFITLLCHRGLQIWLESPWFNRKKIGPLGLV